MNTTAESVFQKVELQTATSLRAGDLGLGLPSVILRELEQSGIESSEIYGIIGPKDEIDALKKGDAVLPPEIAERVSRLSNIINLAEKVFGKREKAFIWLRLPNANLSEKAPIDLVKSEAGARSVENALLQIEYGVHI